MGQDPLRLQAKAGPHTVRLEADGHTPREVSVQVRAGAEQPVEFALTALAPPPMAAPPAPPIALVPTPGPTRPASGVLIVRGTPAGAVVFLDGRKVGRVGSSPLRVEIDAGRYTLRLDAAGYKPREARIVVKANTEQPIEFELERLIESLRAGTIQRRGRDNAEMVYISAGYLHHGGHARRRLFGGEAHPPSYR